MKKKMKGIAFIIAVVGLTNAATPTPTPRVRYGLIGYGITMYDPSCAFGCIDSIKKYKLDCEDHQNMDNHHNADDNANANTTMEMEMDMPVTPKCKATSDIYLKTMAFCFHQYCPDIANSTLQKTWETDIVGRLDHQPIPKYSYQEALALALARPPTIVVPKKEVLNQTSLVSKKTWFGNTNAVEAFESAEITASTYGIILFVITVGIPIVLSSIRFVIPSPSAAIISKFYSLVIDPPLFGNRHAQAIMGLGFMPTRGQGLFIASLWIINIILSTINIQVRDPMPWYETTNQQIVVWIANRVGVLSFVNLALSILFGTRNNVLLYLTNWSHSTYLLAHRWSAIICMLQACLHSALYLQFYLDPEGEGGFGIESTSRYWIWGTIGTLALVLLMPLSILPIRKRVYSWFLSVHIVLVAMAVIGCMLHIFYRYRWQWGYQNWVWIAVAFWVFDRVLVRPIKLAKNGIKTANITMIDEDYMKITISNIHAQPHGSVYLYFPTISWRFWQNNPFSIAGIFYDSQQQPSMQIKLTHSSIEESSIHGNNKNITDKAEAIITSTKFITSSSDIIKPSLVILARRHRGITARLARCAEAVKPIPVLVEPFHSVSPADASFEYPNIICIAGGVGITGVLPFIWQNSTFKGRHLLFWGVRTRPLVDAVQDIVGPLVHKEANGIETWNSFEVLISEGKRLNVKQILGDEIRKTVGGVLVVVCGPAGLMDEARIEVGRLAGEGAAVRLIEESFQW